MRSAFTVEREGILCALNVLLSKLHGSVIVDEVITDTSSSVRTILGTGQYVLLCKV